MPDIPAGSGRPGASARPAAGPSDGRQGPAAWAWSCRLAARQFAPPFSRRPFLLESNRLIDRCSRWAEENRGLKLVQRYPLRYRPIRERTEASWITARRRGIAPWESWGLNG